MDVEAVVGREPAELGVVLTLEKIVELDLDGRWVLVVEESREEHEQEQRQRLFARWFGFPLRLPVTWLYAHSKRYSLLHRTRARLVKVARCLPPPRRRRRRHGLLLPCSAR